MSDFGPMNVDPRGVTNAYGEIEKGGFVMVNREGQYLLVTNRKSSRPWGLPKGHVELGETFREAAIREAREETGYDVDVVKPLPDLTYPHGETGQPIRVHLWLSRPAGGAGVPQEADEVAEWVDFDELKRRVFPNIAAYFDRNKHLLVVD